MLLAPLSMLALLASGAVQDQPRQETLSVRIFISPAGEPFRAEGGDYPSRIWFDRADSNRDGRLTLAEMMIQARGFFNALDTDKSGKIEGEEIRNYEENVAPETRTISSGNGGYAGTTVGGTGGMDPLSGMNNMGAVGVDGSDLPDANAGPRRKKDLPRGAGRFSFFNVAEPVMRADTDLSRSVTTDEFDAWQQEQFNALDTNRRGYLEFADLPRTPAQGMTIKMKTTRGR